MSPIFETSRISVRLFLLTDKEAFADMLTDTKVMRHVKQTMSQRESDLELKRFISLYNIPEKEYNIWAVDSKAAKEMIGLCGVYKNQSGEYEIAYRLRTKYWGHGYGSEVAKSLIDHCMVKMQLPKIKAYADTANMGSIRILNKFMNKVGTSECPSAVQENAEFQLTRITDIG